MKTKTKEKDTTGEKKTHQLLKIQSKNQIKWNKNNKMKNILKCISMKLTKENNFNNNSIVQRLNKRKLLLIYSLNKRKD